MRTHLIKTIFKTEYSYCEGIPKWYAVANFQGLVPTHFQVSTGLARICLGVCISFKGTKKFL